MNLIFITYMRFSYDTYKYIVPDCNHHGGWNSGQFTCGAVCWGSEVKLRLRSSFRFQTQRRLWVWLHLLSQVQEQVNTKHTRAGHSYLRRWAKVRSRAFQSLQKSVKFCVITCSTICPAKVVSLSISKMWALLVLDGYQNLGCSFLCVKRKKDVPVLFPSYFEGTRPNKSQWMRSQRGHLIDIVMYQYWFSRQNSQKKTKGFQKPNIQWNQSYSPPIKDTVLEKRFFSRWFTLFPLCFMRSLNRMVAIDAYLSYKSEASQELQLWQIKLAC